MAQTDPVQPPRASMTVADLEAAIAALPGKKDALHEAFDRLAACSPFPLPFTWEDLDAHISSLQSSTSLRFRQLWVLNAARPAHAVAATAETGDGEKGKNHEDEDEDEEEEEEEEEEDPSEEEEEMQEADEGMQVAADEMDKKNEEEDGSEEGVVEEEVEWADKEIQEADGKIDNKTKEEEEEASDKEEHDVVDEMQVADDDEQNSKDAEKFSLDKEEEEASMEEQDTDMEQAWAKETSAVQGKEEEEEICSKMRVEEGEKDAYEVQGAKNATGKEAKRDLAAACASMDAQRLVKLIYTRVALSPEFHIALRHAPDTGTLALRVVELFLHNKMPKNNKAWANCVGLLQSVTVTQPSTDTIEHAKRVAKDWKQMIDNSETCMVLGNRASWGLLYFLISYNIVSEFDTKEIFRLFGTIPRKQQKKKLSQAL